MVPCNTHHLFNSNVLEEGGQSTINHNMGVANVLSLMCKMPTLFKVLTIFEVCKFDEFVYFIYPIIYDNACTTDAERVMNVMPMKLKLEYRLFNFIMYLKHDNVISYESF